MLVGAHVQHPAVRCDEVDREQVVGRQPVRPAQPADAAADGQAGDSRVGDLAAGGREAERLRLAVELAPRQAGLGDCRLRRRIDMDALHRRTVDHQAVVHDRVPGDAVAAAPHRRRQTVLLRARDGREHVRGAGAAGDDGRPPVYGPVPDASGSLVARVVRLDDLPAKRASQLLDDAFRDRGGHAISLSSSLDRRLYDLAPNVSTPSALARTPSSGFRR